MLLSRLIPFALCLCLLPLSLQAQSDKKLAKAIERFNNGDADGAIAEVHKLAGPDASSEVWSSLVEMCLYRYQGTGSAKDRQALVDVCREAGYTTTNERASMTLRALLVDKDKEPDTVKNEAVGKAMGRAEKAFAKKDYQGAIAGYRDALRIDPHHYKATLYIGDCYYGMKQMDSAIVYFNAAKAMQPELMEPRKYLVDALGGAHQNEAAMQEAMGTFLVYPDESMFLKTADLCDREGKTLERHWLKRGVEANMAGIKQKGGSGPWKVYRDAKAEIEPYCNADGVVDKPGAPGDAKYMEVYCWQRMLQGNVPEELAFAKKMADAGQLDCYVMLCLFHQDFYGQYRAWADANADRVPGFFKQQLIK